MVPLLFPSTSLIISSNSAWEGFWPRDRITVPSSSFVITPVKGALLSVLWFATKGKTTSVGVSFRGSSARDEDSWEIWIVVC